MSSTNSSKVTTQQNGASTMLATAPTKYNSKKQSQKSKIEGTIKSTVMTDTDGKRKDCGSCQANNEIDNMIECEVCKQWYHFSCASVNKRASEMEIENWSCVNCMSSQQSVFSELDQTTHLNGDRTVLEHAQVTNTHEQNEGSSFAANPLNTTKANKKQTSTKRFMMQSQTAAHIISNDTHESFTKLKLQNKSSDETKQQKVSIKQGTSGLTQINEAASSSSSSTNKSLHTKKLELMKLEEKNRWMEEYIEKKYDILQEIASSKGSQNGDLMNSIHSTVRYSKRLAIENWAKSSQLEKTITKTQQTNIYCRSNDSGKSKIRTPAYNEKKSCDQQKYRSSVTMQKPSIISTRQLAARQALPRELPMFTGDPAEWAMFYNNFIMSNEQCNFSNGENIIRLQRCLRGKALDSVRSLLLTTTEVDDIISTLRMRFGRPEYIILTLVNKVKAEPIIKSDNLHQLINFALSVRNLVATIRASGLEEHLSNPTLLYELIEKLPTTTKLEWGKYKLLTGNASLSAFSGWLYNLAEAASEVVPLNDAKLDNRSEQKIDKKRRDYPSYTHELANEFEDGHQVNQGDSAHINVTSEIKSKHPEKTFMIEKPCPVCSGSKHKVDKCTKFLTSSRQQRWTLVTDKALCKLCLTDLHSFIRCRSNVKCSVDGCQRRHHYLLHNPNSSNIKKAPSNKPIEHTTKPGESSANLGVHRHSTPEVLFRIIPVTLYNKDIEINTYAFLDDGSSLTLMDNSIADALKLKGEEEMLCLKWTGNSSRLEKDSQKVNLEIAALTSNRKYNLYGVRTVQSLGLPKQSLDMEIITKMYPHMKNIPLKSYNGAEPKILIGLDNWHMAVPLDIREGSFNEPIACKTRLGWVLGGPSLSHGTQTVNNHNFHLCDCKESNNVELTQLVKSFYTIESYGVNRPIKLLESKEDERARILLEKTTIRKGDHFETGLLWKYDNIEFPDSYPMALKRLKCLEAKINPNVKQNMKKQMLEYVAKGYARKLVGVEKKKKARTWYLPIFVVHNPNKPHKFRMVWDAAAKVKGVSLNTMLLKGPDQLSSLLGILYRARERRVAICGDIREMFHQIRINRQDQDSQRFLWRDYDDDEEPETYIMQVMTFGSSCSPSSAQYVKNINAIEHAQQYSAAANAILKNHYVDDWFQSFEEEDEAIKVSREVKYVHSKAGFEIRNWISNSTKVLTALDEPGKVNRKDFPLGLDQEKVLGVWWDITQDCFRYAINHHRISQEILSGAKPTKRLVLRITMSIFDPMGLIANFLAYAKILMQEISRSKIDWDEEILDKEYDKWLMWIKLLPEIEKVEIPRCYTSVLPSSVIESVQLHIFADSSEKGYAAVAYFRTKTATGVQCCLVSAKTKVSPLKALSIPRLELQAAVLAVRLKNTIIAEHTIKIDKCVFWVDSTTVIGWIRADHRKYKTYVALRIAEILDSSEPDEWRWVPTKDNVADEATKWKGSSTITSKSRWFTGPQFLLQSEENWPQTLISNFIEPTEECRYILTHQIGTPKFITIPDVNRFSRWERLRRAHGYVLRYINNIRAKLKGLDRSTGPLNFDELLEAETNLIRLAQWERYEEEINNISQGQNVSRKSSLYQLSPYLDEKGVLRIRGRIDEIEGVAIDVKRPAILPNGHNITILIVLNVHIKYLHMNNETVVNEIRQRYYITRLRPLVKQISRIYCQQCKNKQAKPIVPEMCQLPPARLAANTRPFTFTGVDYFGPLETMNGRKTEKRWGVLFTCLTVRAIHLEMAYSMSTDSSIMCLRKFIARRGQPLEIYSDNGTNFVGLKNELEKEAEILNTERLVVEYPTIKWKFITPAAPHMGGSWERMIRSVKNCLYQALPCRKPSDELLCTILTEIENIINARPLTYIPLDSECDEALTPNHFLIGSSNGLPSPGQFHDRDVLLRKSWRISQMVADKFWKRWVNEYLPTLTKRTKWHEPCYPIKMGDLVVIVDADRRNSWRRGIIIDAIMGPGQQVRSVVVRTSKGVYTRPVAKVAVLDVSSNNLPASRMPSSNEDSSNLSPIRDRNRRPLLSGEKC